jgi:hypothetical protein
VAAPDKVEVRSLLLNELQQELHKLGEPSYRAGQIAHPKKRALGTAHLEKKKSRFLSRSTKRFLRLVLGNDALQLAPDET